MARFAGSLTAVVAINLLIASKGGLPSSYTQLMYPVLIYAGLTLSLRLALVVGLIATLGPHWGGTLFTDAVWHDHSVLARPLVMLLVVGMSHGISRAMRQTLAASHTLYATMAANFPNGSITAFDRDLRCVFAAGLGLTEVGLGANAMVGRHLQEIVPEDVWASMVPRVEECFTGKPQEFEIEMNGRTRSVRLVPLRLNGAEVDLSMAISQDITELRISERELRDSESRLSQFLDSMPVGVTIFTPDGSPSYSNKMSEAILGRGTAKDARPEELAMVYKAYLEGTDEEYPVERMPAIRALVGEAVNVDDMVIKRPDGDIALQVFGAPIYDGDGHITHSIAAFTDITPLRDAEAAVREMAFHDALTGLANRRLLSERMEHDLALARRQGGKIALLSLDLDDFKDVNDTYGHAAGDSFLSAVAKRLLEATRDTDTVARVGGDEFVVVLPDAGRPEAEQVAARISQSVERPISEGNWMLTPRISIGISVFPDGGTDSDGVLRHADAEMYAAKARRRDAMRLAANQSASGG